LLPLLLWQRLPLFLLPLLSLNLRLPPLLLLRPRLLLKLPPLLLLLLLNPLLSFPSLLQSQMLLRMNLCGLSVSK
jgi:hypothetical protein